jgi:hypothetical protein
MAENKPGPVRVEEPAGFDNPPTDRIPVPGDLSDRRMDAEPLERRADGPRDDVTEPNDDSLKPRDDLAEPYDDSLEPRNDLAEPRDDSLEPRDDLAEPVTDPVEPVAAPVPAPSTGSAGPRAATTLFDDGAADGFRNRWRELQAGFVDDPAQAVRAADELVDEIMRELAERRRSLGDQWRDGPADTEELRVVIQEYRAFFNQLLNS